MAGIDSLSGNYLNNVNTSMTNKAAESKYTNSSMDAYACSPAPTAARSGSPSAVPWKLDKE